MITPAACWLLHSAFAISKGLGGPLLAAQWQLDCYAHVAL